MKAVYKTQYENCIMAPTEHPELFVTRWEKQIGYYLACVGVLETEQQLDEFIAAKRLPVSY